MSVSREPLPGATWRRSDLRTGLERRVRASWRDGAGAGLRAAATLFGLAADLRNFAYDSGLLASRAPPLPTVSVGGLTVGGSGKTPLTSELAGWAVESGLRPAVLSRGFSDELAVHAHLQPDAVVLGHPDRERAAAEAAASGADIAYLDDGFQHRRLDRDVDVVLVDVDLLLEASRLRLPAGPYRERWSALGRADAVVFVRRGGTVRGTGVLDWAPRRLPRHTVAACRLRPGRVEPWSPGARRLAEQGEDPDPETVVASIMKPDVFLRQVHRLGLRPSEAYLLPDHGLPPERIVDRLGRGEGGGVLGTLKDVVKLGDLLPSETPVWCLTDEVAWEAGREALRSLVTHGALRREGRRRAWRGESDG